MEFIDYVVQNHEQIISLFLEHIELTFIAVGISILIGVPIGILLENWINLFWDFLQLFKRYHQWLYLGL